MSFIATCDQTRNQLNCLDTYPKCYQENADRLRLAIPVLPMDEQTAIYKQQVQKVNPKALSIIVDSNSCLRRPR